MWLNVYKNNLKQIIFYLKNREHVQKNFDLIISPLFQVFME